MAATSPATILTAETVPAYLKANASNLVGVFPENASLKATPILGGNVNYAFQVTNDSNNESIFVKQAPEFVAVFGPDGFPLTSERMQLEIDVYHQWIEILGSEAASAYLPKIHYFDRSHMTLVLEFLEGYDLLEHMIVKIGMIPDVTSNTLGEFMGRVHAATHASKLSRAQVDKFTKDYENRAMRDVQLEFVFSKCYAEAEPAHFLREDPAFMAEIEQLKAAYNGTDGGLYVLCHGDLHPGSVMVNEAGSAKVIDPEFTVYGPAGLDVGSLLSGFILGAVHHAHMPNRDQSAVAIQSIRTAVVCIFESYSAAMSSGGISSEDMSNIEADTVGFAIAEVARTSLGFAGGRKWLQFEDPVVKAAANASAMAIVKRSMVKRRKGMQVILDELDALVPAS